MLNNATQESRKNLVRSAANKIWLMLRKNSLRSQT